MNKFLVLVLCVASASCVELEHLCSSDRFDYEGLTVNAFHRVQHKVTFQSLRHYLIDHAITCDQSEFENQTNYWEVLRLRNRFNRKFAKFYTDELNGIRESELRAKRFDLDYNVWLPLHKMTKVEKKSKCLKIFEQKVWSGWGVFTDLWRSAKGEGFPVFDEAEFEPTTSEAIEMMGKLLKELDIGSGQTFILKSESATSVYYRRGLVRSREFKFLADGPVHLDTNSELTCELFLPFQTDQPDDSNCVPVEDLPQFYQNKGDYYHEETSLKSIIVRKLGLSNSF